jgi:hypothetical protein
MSDLPPGWDKTLTAAKRKMTGQQEPTVGRAVHYVAHGTTDCVAAIITKVFPEPTDGQPVGRCELVVFSSDRPSPLYRNADLVATGSVDSWHWPTIT